MAADLHLVGGPVVVRRVDHARGEPQHSSLDGVEDVDVDGFGGHRRSSSAQKVAVR
jgi:hypothetical protein